MRLSDAEMAGLSGLHDTVAGHVRQRRAASQAQAPTARVSRAPERARAAPAGDMSVGWVPGDVVWNEIGEVDLSASQLDAAMQASTTVGEDVKKAWNAWLLEWRKLRDHYAGLLARLGAAFYTSELKEQVDARRATLASFRETYIQRTTNAVVPSPYPGPSLPDLPPPGSEGESTGMPWWAISLLTLLGLGVVGAGIYYVRRQAHNVAQSRVELDHFARSLTGVPSSAPVSEHAYAAPSHTPGSPFSFDPKSYV